MLQRPDWPLAVGCGTVQAVPLALLVLPYVFFPDNRFARALAVALVVLVVLTVITEWANRHIGAVKYLPSCFASGATLLLALLAGWYALPVIVAAFCLPILIGYRRMKRNRAEVEASTQTAHPCAPDAQWILAVSRRYNIPEVDALFERINRCSRSTASWSNAAEPMILTTRRIGRREVEEAFMFMRRSFRLVTLFETLVLPIIVKRRKRRFEDSRPLVSSPS